MRKFITPLWLIALFMIFSLSVHAQLDPNGNLRLGNEYIEIVVNANAEDTGRFAVDITGGNPVSPSDDGEPLIYGRPRPWTSFTTVQIDGVDYVFGGRTNQRAGKTGKFGQVTVKPTIVMENDQRTILTTTVFGKIEVEQLLTFAKSSTTGLYDTVLIKYRIKNLDTVEHKVGVRMIIDTMLGSNDGAPFRIGDKAITTDMRFTQSELPDFWQAFDALRDTKVTAQGTIKGPDVTTPDKVIFADWGSMADGLWDFKFQPGEEFWREGEFELDSAIALYWNADKLKQGESRAVSTKYGLGGITIVPGILSLGVTSPAEVVFDTKTTSFPVVAYIENTSEIVAKNVWTQIELPTGFEVVGQEVRKNLGNLDPSDTGQIIWRVSPVKGSKLPDKMVYRVKVEASNTDFNQVDRQVQFTPPPQINMWLEYPAILTVYNEKISPNPFEVKVHLKNVGGSVAYDVQSLLILPPGLDFADKEIMVKPLGNLSKNEEYVIPWVVKASNMLSGKLPFGVEVTSLNSPKISLVGEVSIPELTGKIYMVPLRDQIKVGEYFGIQIRVANIRDMQKVGVNFAYETSKVKSMYVSRGTLFIQDGQLLPWKEPFIDRVDGLISDISGDLNGIAEENGVIAEVYFRALEPGKVTFTFVDVQIFNSLQQQIPLKVENLTIEIR